MRREKDFSEKLLARRASTVPFTARRRWTKVTQFNWGHDCHLISVVYMENYRVKSLESHKANLVEPDGVW